MNTKSNTCAFDLIPSSVKTRIPCLVPTGPKPRRAGFLASLLLSNMIYFLISLIKYFNGVWDIDSSWIKIQLSLLPQLYKLMLNNSVLVFTLEVCIFMKGLHHPLSLFASLPLFLMTPLTDYHQDGQLHWQSL